METLNPPLDDQKSLQDRVAQQFGLSPTEVSPAVLERVATDPLYVHHLAVCKGDQAMQGVLLREANLVSRKTHERVSNVELLLRVGAALTRWAASGFTRVPEDTYEDRLRTCVSCPQLGLPFRRLFLYRLLSWRGKPLKICRLCGCDVRKKAWLATEQCPDSEHGPEGRWDFIRI